ncbi:MAG TPA: DUF2169 domain-containing protein [Polyangia bacterium]|jgi:hypothetical protein|nr:DUF2169 domain-containing protein [Polyangia bacterium]
MWQIQNRTPFAVGQGWIRDRDGAETWLVVVKATFDILPDGSTKVSPAQPKVIYSPVHRGEPGASSLLLENDFVLGKKTTDVVVNGTAHAKGGAPVRTMDVAIQVGPVKKVLKVFGERVWGPRGTWLSPPVPFVSMPLTYERAFGGVDKKSEHPEIDWYWPNPVGAGFVKSRSHIEGLRAANVEYPGDPIKDWDSKPAPAGLGIISSHWKERAAFAGTYDAAWEQKRQPLLPTDFDIRHLQTVPKDQQSPTFMRGGEPVALLGLTPSGTLRFALPSVDLSLVTHFMDGERRAHQPPALHTVILEPDLLRVSLVWHSAVECHPKVHKLEKTVVELRKPVQRRTDDVTGDEDDDGGEEGVDNLLDLI